jgi:hypothetical membrane protein
VTTDLTPLQRAGVLAWALRPAYLVVEIGVAVTATTYSFTGDTVSDLGAVSCTEAVCSPGHGVMNGAFVVFGALLAFGAVAIFGRFGRSGSAVAASALLVVSGLSSMAVGFTPLDQHPAAHAAVAAPLFIAQPVALVLLGLLVRHQRPVTGLAVMATGLVCAVAAVAFLVLESGAGITERIALWPVFVALAVVVAPPLAPDRDGAAPCGGHSHARSGRAFRMNAVRWVHHATSRR